MSKSAITKMQAAVIVVIIPLPFKVFFMVFPSSSFQKKSIIKAFLHCFRVCNRMILLREKAKTIYTLKSDNGFVRENLE